MADLTPENIDDVLAACRAGAEEAAEAFGRALDAKIAVTIGEAAKIDLSALPDDLSGPGLAVILTVGEVGVLVLLPEASGLVPPWCADPDPTGESKLSTLAQELGMILLPEQFMPDDFKTAGVKNLAGAVRRGGVTDGAAMVPLELSADDKRATARIIWPVPTPEAVIGSPPAKPKPEPEPQAAAKPQAAMPPPGGKRILAKVRLTDLPDYTRSLLRIKVPVSVTLAQKRQPLGRIVELGAGTIIQFDKSCEEMLELAVGNRTIATGEAVKVGDKFGLRITSIVLPDERFHVVKPKMTKAV